MAPDGFDMSAATLGTFSAYVFASMCLWFGFPVWLSIIITIIFAMIMYLLTMFLILVCKVPDMLATCALQFVHQGLGLAYTGGSAVSAGRRGPSGLPPSTAVTPPLPAAGLPPLRTSANPPGSTSS